MKHGQHYSTIVMIIVFADVREQPRESSQINKETRKLKKLVVIEYNKDSVLLATRDDDANCTES